MNIAGLVLAGGYSTRMQQDKTRLCLIKNTSMIENTITLLSAILPNKEIAISCREGTSWDLDNKHISDIYKESGPLGGIHAALISLEKDILFLPTDLPLMNTALLLSLVSRYQEHSSMKEPPLVYMYKGVHNNRPEPLVSIFRYTALPYIEEALLSDKRRVLMAVPNNKHYYLDYDSSEEYRFHNVNSPEDIALVHELSIKHSLSKGD